MRIGAQQPRQEQIGLGGPVGGAGRVRGQDQKAVAQLRLTLALVGVGQLLVDHDEGIGGGHEWSSPLTDLSFREAMNRLRPLNYSRECAAMQTDPSGPLAWVRVLDASRVLAG